MEYNGIGQWERAIKLFSDMQATKISPNEYTYTAAIDACENADKKAQARELLNDMQAAKVGPCKPDLKLFEPTCKPFLCNMQAADINPNLARTSQLDGAPAPWFEVVARAVVRSALYKTLVKIVVEQEDTSIMDGVRRPSGTLPRGSMGS